MLTIIGWSGICASAVFGIVYVIMCCVGYESTSYYHTRYRLKKIKEETYVRVGNTIGVLAIVGAVLSLVCLIGWCILTNVYGKDTVFIHEFNILAMNDKDDFYIRGNRVHFDGGTKSMYYFIRNWDGGKKEGCVPASDSIIYETDEVPHIECYIEDAVDPNKHPFVTKLVGEPKWKGSAFVVDRLYKIYIPKNSVIDGEYEIDLK